MDKVDLLAGKVEKAKHQNVTILYNLYPKCLSLPWITTREYEKQKEDNRNWHLAKFNNIMFFNSNSTSNYNKLQSVINQGRDEQGEHTEYQLHAKLSESWITGKTE